MARITRRDFLKMAGAAGIGAILFGSFNYFLPEEQPQETKSNQYNKSSQSSESEASDYISIEGNVTHVDEDEFLVLINRSVAGSTGNIQFEIYNIKTDVNELTLVYPGPQSVKIGDRVKLSYKPSKNRKVSTEDILNSISFRDTDPQFNSHLTYFEKSDITADGLIMNLYRE